MDASSWKFTQALLSFDTGAGSADLLAGALDADLAAGVRPANLDELLQRHHGTHPLPSDLYQTLAKRLQPASPEPGVDDDDTIDLEASGQRKPVELLPGVDLTGPPLAGRYQLLESLGRGGTSEVYKAIDLQQAALGDTNYYVAIKLAASRAISAEAMQELTRHLEVLRGLVHVNVARPLDWGSAGELFYISIEYVDGESLQQRLRRGSIPRAEAMLLIGKVADGLEAAHRQSIVHGDLKPGNILVTDTGEVKLIDFAWEGVPRRTVLTPRYASPQRMERVAPEQADDVFAVACIAFELLTGKAALTAPATSRDPRSLPRSDQLSAAQVEAFRHALNPDQQARTASARMLVQELLQHAPRPRAPWFRWLPAALAVGLIVGFIARQYLAAPPPPLPPAAEVVPPPPPSEPGTIIRDCATCAALQVIPAGTFVRGAGAEDAAASRAEKPQQSVTIARPIAVAINPVTVGEFREFVEGTGRDMQGCEIYDGVWHVDAAANWQNPGFAQTLQHPVTCVSWTDASAYAVWLSQKSGHQYRLPSAAEWEYAARAGATAAVPWASAAEACLSANVADQSAARRYPGFTVFACDDNYANTAPVGSYAANAFGLHDMLGNVLAWTGDCWSATYAGAPADGSARQAADCEEHEMRGGSWFSAPAVARVSSRNHFAADYRGSSVGIRLVRDLTP